MRYLHFTALTFGGLFAGFLTSVLVLELSLRGYSGPVYTQVRLVELEHLDKLAVATLFPALIATAALAWRAFATNLRWWTIAAFAMLVLVVAITVGINLPINSDQLDWVAQSPPDNWATIRDRWQIAHTVRTIASALAFAALGVAALLPAVETASTRPPVNTVGPTVRSASITGSQGTFTSCSPLRRPVNGSLPLISPNRTSQLG